MALELFGMQIPSFMGIIKTMMIIFIVFFVFMIIVIFLIIFYFNKKKIPVKLFQQRAGENSYKYIEINARRTKVKGVQYLKLWRMGVVDKLIPEIENKFLFPTKGNKDILNLMQDSNGYIHKICLPSTKQILHYYTLEKLFNKWVDKDEEMKEKVEKEYDEEKKEFLEQNKEYDVFFQPNPHESIETLINIQENADKNFGLTWLERYGHYVLPLSALLFSTMIFMMGMIFTGKLFG